MKNRFFPFSLLLVFIFLCYSPKAQAQGIGDELNREIGLRLTGLNSMGIIYKKKKADNKYRRYRLGLANIAFNGTSNSQAFDLRANLAVGYEKRKAINDKFHFIHGLEFLGDINVSASNNRAGLNLSPGLGFVLGFQYAFSKDFYAGLELVPFVNTTFGVDQDGFRDAVTVNAGFNSQSASLNLVYRFQSNKVKNNT